MQPPGKRMKPGFKSASHCATSARRPFGRSLNVFSGKSDTMSMSTAPWPSTITFKRALASVALALRGTVNFLHSGVSPLSFACASRRPAAVSSSTRTATGPPAERICAEKL